MHRRVSFDTDQRVREAIKAEQKRLAKASPGAVPSASAAIRSMILRASAMAERRTDAEA